MTPSTQSEDSTEQGGDRPAATTEDEAGNQTAYVGKVRRTKGSTRVKFVGDEDAVAENLVSHAKDKFGINISEESLKEKLKEKGSRNLSGRAVALEIEEVKVVRDE